jgi:hypothetical protein
LIKNERCISLLPKKLSDIIVKKGNYTRKTITIQITLVIKICYFVQGWIHWRGGGCTPLALARGGAIFHDKQKIIRGQNEIQ